MPKRVGFPKNCSHQSCDKVYSQIRKSKPIPIRSKEGKMVATRRHRLGGLGWENLRIARTIGGPAIKFKRCEQFEYKDSDTKKMVKETCTDSKIVNIPRRTIDCYREVSPFLKKIASEKRGRPGEKWNIFGLLACHKGESLTPAIVSAVTEVPYEKVRRALESTDQLVKNGFVVCERKKRMDIIGEEPCRVPKQYSKKFFMWLDQEKKKRAKLKFPKRGKLPTPDPWRWMKQ